MSEPAIFAGDCASDPPLGATLRALACAHAEDVLLGLAALAPPKCKLQLTVRHDDAEAELREAALRLEARVEIMRLPDAWPPRAAGPDARELVAASPRRPEGPSGGGSGAGGSGGGSGGGRRYLTVAGAVREPLVLVARGETPLAELADRAGGPVDEDWMPVAFDGAGPRLYDRDDAWAGEPLLVILPARHALVQKCKTPLTDWLVRAASACEGCRICSEACAHLEPHEVVWTLATGRDDGVALLETLACTGCALCDAVCPSALSPRALVVDARQRLRAAGANVSSSLRKTAGTHAAASGLDVKLLTQRLGLAEYDREPLRRI
jgi:hypothetical protein